MRKDEAQAKAARLEARYPMMRAYLIINGASALKERGLPLPAWKTPADSWVLLSGCRRCSWRSIQGNTCDYDLVVAAWPLFIQRKHSGQTVQTFRTPSRVWGCKHQWEEVA